VILSVTDISVLFFKSTEHSPDAPPHFFILFPLDKAICFLVTFITSNVEGRSFYYRDNEKATKSLIPVDNNVFEFLRKKSIIDCNQSRLLTVEELIATIDPDGPCDIVSRKFPSYLREEIIKAILGSPLIERYIKNIVKRNYRGKG